MRQRIKFCTTEDGVRLAIAAAGKGPPLVRAGNWFTHIEQDWESPVWQHWFDFLSERHTLIRYDPRGTGLSDRNATDLSLDAWVRDLECVADSLGLERFPLIGLCQGGTVAAAYAARHPDRISRLALYDSYLSGTYVPCTDPRLTRQARTLEQLIALGWGRETGAFREIFANLLMPDGGREHLRWLGDLQRQSASPQNARRIWASFNSFDIRAEVKSITASTLVFHVRGDSMVPFEAGRRLAAEIPSARFMPLEGRNHILLPHEPAWRIFNEELRQFLDGEAADGTAPECGLAELTTRESEILEQIARGLSNTEIANALTISEKTVRNNITRIFSKLSVARRAQAIVRAREAGLGRAD